MDRRRYMGVKSGGGLPYDSAVTYLECTGTQFIVTDFAPNQDNVRCVFKAEKTVAGTNAMIVHVNVGGYLFHVNWYAQTAYFRFRGVNKTLVANVGTHIFELGNTSKVDSTSTEMGGTSSLVGNTTCMTLFATSDWRYFFNGKIYYVKVYYGDTLVLDLIPVRVGQVGYMYDRVSGELFGNEGTGDFLIGEDVEERYDEYVTFVAQEAGTFTLTIPADVASTSVTSVSYSVDDGTTWVTTPNVDSTEVVITTPTIASGNKVIWKGTATNYANDSSIYSNFSATGNFKIYGNIVSLFNGDDFLTQTSVATQYACTGLFRDNTKVTDVEHLVLGMTTLQRNFGANMFRNCTALKRAFKLNVKTGTTCQNAMPYCFAGCTSLTYIPDITLQKAGSESTCNAAFSYMFQGCVSLKKAPKISSNVCTYQQFMHMFENCTALEEVPSLEDITVCGLNGFSSMFSGCTSLKAAPKLPTGTSLNASSFANMFYGCTSLETASELPWTTLATSCYGAMYQGCTSLKLAPILPAKTLLSDCYSSMFRGCRSLEYVKMLATDISASNCLNSWMGDVKAGGTFVKSHDLESIPSGNSGVPSTWTIIDDTDE